MIKVSLFKTTKILPITVVSSRLQKYLQQDCENQSKNLSKISLRQENCGSKVLFPPEGKGQDDDGEKSHKELQCKFCTAWIMNRILPHSSTQIGYSVPLPHLCQT